MRLGGQFAFEFEIVCQPPIRFGVIDRTGHEQISGVVISFGLNEAGVETGELWIAISEGFRENLKFFATTALDQCATDQMIDDLNALPFANGAHQARDPGT